MRAILLPLLFSSPLLATSPADYRKAGQPVAAWSGGTILCEAEEFRVEGKGGWQARPWGENYFVATFANSFLSRKGFLGAPEQCGRSVATLNVQVPKAGRYLVLARYESVYRYETQFWVVIEQDGKTVFERRYGARDNVKVWAFGEKLKKELAWSWGAVENVVWEGHDAGVNLAPGRATISLIATRQDGNAARRNVDCLLLTTDEADVKQRIEKESYLPLDGLLTQEGDVFMKVHCAAGSPDLSLTAGIGTEHSPYWVHQRKWKPKTVTLKSGKGSDWVEVGSLLDTLNDGQWLIRAGATGPQASRLLYALEFGVRDVDGKIKSIRRFENLGGDVTLAYDADTRYSRRIRRADDVLYDLVAELKQQKVRGTPPKRTLIYGSTFDKKKDDPRFNAAVDEFIKLTGATALNRTTREGVDRDGSLVRGYIDLRGQGVAQLEQACKKLEADKLADRVAVVSLGDEIGLAPPPANDHTGFRAWLRGQGLTPADVDPQAKSWNDVRFTPAKTSAASKPALFYFSRIYAHRYGIGKLKELTDVLRKHLPNAGVGANFSPHHKSLYLGDTHHWISMFREGGMTMPWGEDYIWQVPVGTCQMNFLMVDMFRAGIRGKKDAKIHYYVMPHTPGNTTATWRRQFYGDLAHGVKVFNLFEYRPVQAAYTENHCSDPAMFKEIRKSFHELGTFEDFVQDGAVRPAEAGLWFSEAADVWDDYQHSFGAGKRSLYIAIRQQQLPLDCVLEGDDLKGLKVLYLADRHVSRAASKAIAAWVNAGGRLFATAGAGMYDELNQPNKVLRQLLGVQEQSLDNAKEDVTREKEHLPFATPLDTVTLRTNATPVKWPVFGTVSRVSAAKDAVVMATFKDGTPAVTQRQAGKGRAYYCGFLPGLSYFAPAIPRRPVDRGSTDDTMAHFIPTAFDRGVGALVATPAEEVKRPVVCSEPLVESTVIESRHGTLIPLVNWGKGPAKGLKVRLNRGVPVGKVSLASGNPVTVSREDGKAVLTLDLDVADALVCPR